MLGGPVRQEMKQDALFRKASSDSDMLDCLVPPFLSE